MEANTTVGLDTDKSEDISIEEELHWDMLISANNDIVNRILQQQALILELSKKFKDVLEKDESIFHSVNGLMLSVMDLAKEIPGIKNSHSIDGVMRTGVITEQDDMLLYLQVASDYIAVEENLSNIMATTYLDIFSRLSTDEAALEPLKKVLDGEEGEEDAGK